MPSERQVKLWDGKLYSIDEVEAACPGLAAYAAENESLDANFPAPELPRLRLALAALLVITLGTATVLRLYGVGWLGTAVTAGLLFLAGLLPILYAIWVRSWRYPRTVAIKEGMLSITTPCAKKEFPLEQCWWKWGTTFHNGGFILSGKKRPAIVIVCPQEGAEEEDMIIATDEAFFQRWHAFLVLAGVPSIAKRSGLRKAAMLLAHILAGGLLGLGAGKTTGSVVDQLRGDKVLGDLIAFASTFTGCFLGFIYVVAIYFEGPLSFSLTQQLTHFYVPVLKIFALYGVSLAIASQNALVGMLIVTVSLGIGGSIAYGFTQQKLRQQRRAQTKASEPIPFANPIEGL